MSRPEPRPPQGSLLFLAICGNTLDRAGEKKFVEMSGQIMFVGEPSTESHFSFSARKCFSSCS